MGNNVETLVGSGKYPLFYMSVSMGAKVPLYFSVDGASEVEMRFISANDGLRNQYLHVLIIIYQILLKVSLNS